MLAVHKDFVLLRCIIFVLLGRGSLFNLLSQLSDQHNYG